MDYSQEQINELKMKAIKVRANILEMIPPGKVGHLGGSSSIADVMAALYFSAMHINPSDVKDPSRDRVIMSKGHAVLVQYACLVELGFFGREELAKVKTFNGMLQGHPDMDRTPGIEAVTGSLGQGLSVSLGMALGLKLDHNDARVYAICGDGELAEGQIWEAVMAAHGFAANNLTAIVDFNGVQATDTTKKIFPIENLNEKWKAFGWNVLEIDGHDMVQILGAIDAAKAYTEGPTVILAHTVKGKCFPFAEGKAKYHNASMTEEEYKTAWECIDRMKREI
ncbi:transketolase, beta subunit [Sphaerochaeta pleomorpha str. Grapes]|uniref:Transketolase, beta subunit n=1 Tax=Sphaerochaeta pleomorpha (strain ATCC BAA-1885 / DSM 22778 / Grapes) TaxID=158190 RepID=G8QV35_SPHPG|nr:transketolase [Sphaerochaeta pleomorpha]AEV29271.1 transketolase, beta subunit [Sphaerochaeta pleomorpha str. Grapes]